MATTSPKWQPLRQWEARDRGVVWSLAELPDGKLAVASSTGWYVGGAWQLWQPATGECLRTVEEQSAVRSLVPLTDGSLAAGTWNHGVAVYDSSSGAQLRRWGTPGPVLAMLRVGAWLVCAHGGQLSVWLAESGTAVKTIEGSHFRLALLPDSTVATGGRACISILQTGNWTVQRTLELGVPDKTSTVLALAPLTGGHLAAGGQGDLKDIQILSLQDGSCTALRGHTNDVNALAQLPDLTLASASDDTTLRIWSIAQWTCLQTLQGHTSSVLCLAVLRDGTLASGGGDRKINIWKNDSPSPAAKAQDDSHTSGSRQPQGPKPSPQQPEMEKLLARCAKLEAAQRQSLVEKEQLQEEARAKEKVLQEEVAARKALQEEARAKEKGLQEEVAARKALQEEARAKEKALQEEVAAKEKAVKALQEEAMAKDKLLQQEVEAKGKALGEAAATKKNLDALQLEQRALQDRCAEHERKLRRREADKAATLRPRHWTMSMLPQGWTAQPVDRGTLEILKSLCAVSQADELGKGRDAHRYHRKYNTLQLHCAWRIEDPALWARFCTERDIVSRQIAAVPEDQRPGFGAPKSTGLDEALPGEVNREVNEAWLLHGTKPGAVLSILSAGLNDRVAASSGAFGAGVYLAEDIEKTDQYAEPDRAYEADDLEDLHSRLFRAGGNDHPGEDLFYVFIVRSICGLQLRTTGIKRDGIEDEETGTQLFMNSERRELVNFPGVKPPVSYHSLLCECGRKIRRFREFVLVNSGRTYIEYLVAYKRLKV